MRSVVLTDLDGTLLDGQTYDWRPAARALAAMAAADVPLVICTSKTRAEVEVLRRELDHRHPFTVENGGAAYVPLGYFGSAQPGSERRDEYEVVEMGTPYAALVAALECAARAARVSVKGWHGMTVEEVSARCGLDLHHARLAVRREYDEPFTIDDPDPENVARLASAIAGGGHRMTRGDRFFHITGTHDKASAARPLLESYRRAHGALRVIAAGDAPNDATMLTLADDAVIVESPHAAVVHARVPRARRTRLPGPEGWNEAMLGLLGPASPS